MLGAIRKLLYSFTCQHYTELSSRRLDGELSNFERAKFYLHHAICTFCRRSTRQFVLIERATEKLVHEETLALSKEAKERMKNSVKSIEKC